MLVTLPYKEHKQLGKHKISSLSLSMRNNHLLALLVSPAQVWLRLLAVESLLVGTGVPQSSVLLQTSRPLFWFAPTDSLNKMNYH